MLMKLLEERRTGAMSSLAKGESPCEWCSCLSLWHHWGPHWARGQSDCCAAIEFFFASIFLLFVLFKRLSKVNRK